MLERSGGAARVAWRLVKAQLLAGHDAKLLVGRRESDAEFCEKLEARIAVNLTAEYRRQGLLYYEFQGSHFLPEHPLVKAADIIHLHNLHGNYFNPFSLLLLGRWKPVVWTLHDMQALTGHCAHSMDCERWRQGCGECPYLLTYPAVEVDQTARLWADKKLIYDHVPFQTTAPSRWLADMTMEGAIARHPARVIPNGVDTEVFIPHDKKAARQRLGLPLDGFITGGVAHGGALVNGWKGGRYSLEAFQTLLERFPDSYYVSVGGNEYHTECDGHLIILPSVEEESDLAWVYSALDLYLMTSTAESFSLVVIEAMACGVPVLAFATGGVPDLVTSGVNGLVVGYLDQPALNEALLFLAANPQVLAVMAANTRETSCRYYDHRLVTGWYEELYHEYRQRWPFELGRFARLSFPEIPQPVRTEPFIRALQRIPDENYENLRILSPKRILVINNLYPPQELGGYGRLLCDFANILEKRGHTIQVLTSDTPYLGQIEKDEFNIDRSLLLYGGWQDGVCKQVDDNDRVIQTIKTNLEKVRSIVRKFRPELCLLGNIDFLSHMIFSPLLEMSIPVIHHLGNKIPGYSVNDTPQSNLYRLATASRWLRDEIMRQGYPVKEISVVYPGALVEEFRTHALPALDKLRIAYAGIVLPYKGPHILIEALKRLHDRGADFSCALAGTTTDVAFVDQLKKFVVASGMEDKIDFLGFLPRERLKAFFAEHNILVFPSIVQEAFGISQVEAMAAGLTVVSSGTGGAKEIIEHRKSGLIFESKNSESLAQELLGLAENPEKWQSIAKGGRKRAIEKFDIERSVDILEQEFSKLICGQRPAVSEYNQVKTGGEVIGNYDRLESQEQGVSMKSPG
jgi:glycosyltransferase involved in cell wall biosynthesis